MIVTKQREAVMGVYLNPGNDAFAESLNSEIYVDKSNMIHYTNRVLGTSALAVRADLESP